jgi:phage shock protein A
VLGAIDSSTLATQRELKDLEREHDKWRRELEARLNAARSWEAEIESYYLQARGLGLLAGSPPPDAGWALDRYMLELQRVPGSVREMDLPDVQEGTAEAAVTELTQLITQEDELAQQIGSLRRRLGKLDQLSSSVNEYGVTLTGQQDRIEGVGWFERRMADQDRCPVCAAIHPEGNTQLADLKTLASELKQVTESVGRAPPKLDQEIASLRVELRELEGGLSKTRQKRKDVEGRSAELSAQRQKVRQIYLFVGRVEQALENVAASRNVELLRAQVAALAERIANLRRELDPALQADRLSAAIESVSSRIAHYAQLLRLEHATENVRLNIRELTLQFNPLSGRTDFLWEVGSGQNWVGYHIAGLLALHEHFITVRHNPVPRFLVIDQPSQVYFPEGWPAAERRFGQTKAEDSPDIQGVRRIFQALSHFLDAVDHEFQIIVTEHAGPITWEGVDNVHVVGNWRGNQEEFLIPGPWLRRVP